MKDTTFTQYEGNISHETFKDEKNEQLLEVKQVKDTPFELVIREESVLIVWGNDLLLACKDEEEALQRIEERHWILIGTYAMCLSARWAKDKK